ncbi:plexin-B [Drosophila tropicalis]|uniref:plexin-B n=1 Tax=Drosophila tropicalis TaxID=46794 RepID=UPI0035ABFC4D
MVDIFFILSLLMLGGKTGALNEFEPPPHPAHQFASNDIVAQFSLPAMVGGVATGTDSSSTSTAANYGNRSASNSVHGSTVSRDGQTKNYFTHLSFDAMHNVLYAGATNKILKLNENLRVLSEAVTGPKHDAPQCHAGGCPEDVETTLINNYNKILVVSYAHNEGILISCGSIRQGACEIYSLPRFPSTPQFIAVPLAANDEYASTYAFVGPARYSWKEEDILYVGTTFTNVGDYRHDVPAISSRRLDDLNYAEFSIQQSIINIDVKYRDHFLVDYVYGFNSSEYAYFVLVQKKSHLAEENGYVTRLARICITDSNYDSYTEITIQCTATDDNVDYNILRDAKITHASQKLAQQMGIKRDDHVLVTIFSPSKEISDQPENSSAMCIYSLKDIDDVFIENIHMCFNGTIKDRNLGYISGTINDGRCPIVGSLGNIYNFCSVGLKLSGVAPISAHALFHFPNVSITSVTATTTTDNQHSLAFLGTEKGTIKKVLLSGQRPGEYEEIVVDPGNRILPNTMMSPKKDFLYVLSLRKITKLRIEHCSAYTNCSACLESRDPFCGWCSLEKRCTVRSACQRDTSASRWLSLGSGQQCIDFESIIPDKIPISELTQLQLIIRTLPEPFNAKYRCVFGNSTPIDAEILEHGLICATPPLDQRPQIPSNTDHVLVPLSVRSSETNKDFVSRSFAFFDCSHHVNCQACVSSSWGCNWCIFDNKCVHKLEQCRNMENAISTVSQCPHLKRNREAILLPVRVPKEIRLEIENLPKPKSAHAGFLCTVHIEAAQMLLPAHIEFNKVVVCEKTPYFYETNTHEYEAKVDITWNRQHYVDTAMVTLYKCDVLGSHREHADCSLCVTREPKYQCAWCGNSCVYNETCVLGGDNMQVGVGAPLANQGECPRPRIDIIKPLSGPIEGGTLVTIEGSNLGIREEDVRGKISIGSVPCELVNYQISVKIECRTGAAPYEMSAPIKVANEAGYTESSVQFHFKDVQLTGLYPTVGPKSGGTQVSLMGKYLNIGSSIRAFLDEYECHINVTQASSSRVTCITSEATQPEPIRSLRLVVDGANRTFTCKNPTSGHSFAGHQQLRSNYGTYQYQYHIPPPQPCSIFNYTQDPRIMQIKPLRSFVSGGRILTVHGMYLDSVQKPELEVFFDTERVNKTSCLVIDSSQMECPSPPVNMKFQSMKNTIRMSQSGSGAETADDKDLTEIDRQKRGLYTDTFHTYTTSGTASSYFTGNNMDVAAFVKVHETQLNLQLSFVMDNVQLVRDLNKYFHDIRSSIVYLADPKYLPFPNDGVKLYKGDTLVIEGELLNLAADEYDVNVTIGTAQCNITSLALTQLLCIPPEQQPPSTDENGVDQVPDLPLVVVKVGRNLRFVIGYLKYDLNKPYAFSHALLGIIISVAALVILLVIVLIIFRRKSTQAEREYKRIQIQMITLESNVRSECKQAFAELQTELMTDLTADLESSGIPSLDHVNYIMKVFFPGVSDHPILNSPKLRGNSPQTNYDAAMIQFEQLIGNKYFLLIFIETLEAQRSSFSIRDRVNVASLLMVVLMNKMEYATEILKSLLLRLIDKSLTSKHPQLMLRRTESVVEKMLTNYLAICMYDYLKEYAGSSLFLLFKAIKHQVEKGLVDAITNDARYSLSEERLLHEQITHSVVILHILQDDLDEKVQCRVNDWDTISQVKLKILDAIFKNTPFSMRPLVHEVDLEWRHGRGGHLTLQDEDLTTKTINGWKRLNTLAHYGVKESAVMSLIARQNDSYNIPYNKHQHPAPYHNFYYINNSQSHIIMNNDVESGLQQPRIYHLVKPVIPDHYMNMKNSALSGAGTSQSTHCVNNTNERVNKTIPEVYLTRLLATKGTIQKFVDDFFAIILTVNEELPPAVKWLFDLLDEAAKRHDIVDTDIVHAWKSNSLPLRFWVNFIKNPDFIFDVNKTYSVDSCLSVIAQTFMDACSTAEHRLGKDSPSNKLLFAKDIPNYRAMVKEFYRDVARLPQISDQEMSTAMQQLSVQQTDEFHTISALKELYIYVTKYREQIMDALESDINCRKMQLSRKLENVACTLDGEDTSNC